MRTRVLRAALPVAGGAALAAIVATAAPVAAQAGPPGDNGTVKVDGVDFDDHPNNEPHPGCVFQVDFYGFDEGDLFADVTFEAIEPTGQVEPLLQDDGIDIGEDDNSGGGSEAGLDASRTYDLTDALANITPHPEQGWHVKLTVHADGSIGADTKFKVFWVSGCETPPTTSTTKPDGPTTSTTKPDGPTTSTTRPDGSTTTTMDRHETTTTVAGDGGPGSPTPGQPVGVEPTSAGGGLPTTGSNSLGLVALALGLVCIGTGVVLTTRRLRTPSED